MRRLSVVLLALAALVALIALPAVGRGNRPHARVAIFYYPWYGTPARDGTWLHWNQNGHKPPNDLATQYYPRRGAYSSGDPHVVAAQMAEIRQAGVGEVVVSWWGRGSEEDRRLPLVLRAAQRQGIEVAAHLEPYGTRTIESVAADLAYFRGLGIHDVFVYDPFTLSDAGWADLNAHANGVRLFAGTAFVRRAAEDRFDGVYTYDVLDFSGFNAFCEAARRESLLCAPSVGPGFDGRRAAGITRTRSRHRGSTYDALWRAALRAKPDLVTITSYNEWHEGTQIEPSRSTGFFGGNRYATYDGAWGTHGRAAGDAYLVRTAHWAHRFERQK